MTTRKKHRHWVTAIETECGDPYGGIRVMVHHARDDAMTDLREWIEEELNDAFVDAEVAIQAYTVRRKKNVVVEEQDA